MWPINRVHAPGHGARARDRHIIYINQANKASSGFDPAG